MMSQETDISSWFHANFESGIDTDVVRKEQLWQKVEIRYDEKSSSVSLVLRYKTMILRLLKPWDIMAKKVAIDSYS